MLRQDGVSDDEELQRDCSGVVFLPDNVCELKDLSKLLLHEFYRDGKQENRNELFFSFSMSYCVMRV